MRIYKRSDGFEVHDAQNRSKEWAGATYGGWFVEIEPDQISPLEEDRALIIRKLEELERSIYYSELTGDIDSVSGRTWADIKKDQWLVLRQQLLAIGGQQ